MNKQITTINKTLPKGITAKFIPAEDSSVDSEIALFVEGYAEAPAGIQLSGRYFCANCWTGTDMDAMHHAPEERSLTAAVGHAVALLRKYQWIKS